MVAWVLLVLVLVARGGGQGDQVARVTLLQQQVCSQETSRGPGAGRGRGPGAGEVVCRCQGPRGEQAPAYLGVRLQGFLLHSAARTRGHQVRLYPIICKLSGLESVQRITVTNWSILH